MKHEEDSYAGRLFTSRRDSIAYGTIPCIDPRKEDLDGLLDVIPGMDDCNYLLTLQL